MDHHLYYGDCVSLMRLYVKDETVDLVYLDPPWQPDRACNVLYREKDGSESEASVDAFARTWRWDNDTWIAHKALLADGDEALVAAMDSLRRYYSRDDSTFAYLVQMGTALTEVRRVLKPGGSAYLHCDSQLSAPLRMLADAVFVDGFQSEIIRMFRGMPSGAKRYRRAHETLYFYSKGEYPTTFNMEYEPPAKSTKKRMNGQKQHRAPGATKKTRCNEPSKPPRRDTWYFGIVAGQSREKVPGFKTQKPLRMLKRIVSVSSNPGDLVLDPFCGSGVTLYASHLLQRRSLCMDITHLAIDEVRQRLADPKYPEYAGVTPVVHGDPVDLAGARALAAANPDALQDWVGRRLGASGVHKRGPDDGIDDRLRFHDGDEVRLVVISVKGGAKVKSEFIDQLIGVVERRNAAIGVFVSFHKPTTTMINHAAVGVWTGTDGRSYPKIQILTIEDMLGGRGVLMPTTLAAGDIPQNQRYHDFSTQAELFPAGS